MSGTTESGTRVVMIMMVVTGVLTILLAFNAARREYDYERTTRRVVGEYASVIGNEIVRRDVFELEMSGFAPLRGAMVSGYSLEGHIPSLALLRLAVDPVVRKAAFLPDHLFVLDTEKNVVSPSISSAADDWIRKNLKKTVESRLADGSREYFRFDLPDGPHFLGYAIADLDQGRIYGFTFHEADIRPFLERGFGRRSAFLGFVGGAALSNRDLFMRISQGPLDLFQTAGAFIPAMGTSFTVPAGYGDAFGGCVVNVSLSSAAVNALVAGGVPASGLPLLGALLVLILLVLFCSAVVLNRGRQLAVMRANFLASVSHELRTPLTQIRVSAETLLLNRVRSEAERQRSLQVIDREAVRLTHLVDNVLAASRRDGATFELTRRIHDVLAVTAETVEAFRTISTGRNVAIRLRAPSSLFAVIDENAYRQMLINLLENAVKFGPTGQTVIVTLEEEGSFLRLLIDDEGPGVEPADRRRIWKRFSRGSDPAKSVVSGSGLGLSVVRELVEAHHGRYRVESAPGKGARFVIDLPLNDGEEQPVFAVAGDAR